MKFRKKPIVIEARQLSAEKFDDIANWCGGRRSPLTQPGSTLPYLVIPTLEGDHVARLGDWIIQGIKGEFYPCKPEIFEASYEAVNP